MKRLFVISTAALLLVAIQIPGFAHHSVSAQFDSSKATTITGMITKVDWANPHAWLYMTVRNGNQSVTWHVQISAPGALKQVGIEKGMIDLTSPVAVEVWPAFSDEVGFKTGHGRMLTLPDGRKLDVSDKWPMGKGPNNPR